MFFNSSSLYPGLEFSCTVRYFCVTRFSISSSKGFSLFVPFVIPEEGVCDSEKDGVVAEGYFVELFSVVDWFDVLVNPLIYPP